MPATVKKTRKKLATLIREFGNVYHSISNLYETASRVYVMALDSYPESAKDEFAAAYPSIDRTTWRRLAKLGRGKLDVRLMDNRTHMACTLAHLSKRDQTKILNNGVSVYDPKSGKRCFRRVSLEDLTFEERDRVFDSNAVRTVAQQKAWMASNKHTEADDSVECEVKGKKLYVYKPAVLSLARLKRIVREMEK